MWTGKALLNFSMEKVQASKTVISFDFCKVLSGYLLVRRRLPLTEAPPLLSSRQHYIPYQGIPGTRQRKIKHLWPAAQGCKPQPLLANHHPARTLTPCSIQVSSTSRNCQTAHGGNSFSRMLTADQIQMQQHFSKLRCFLDCSGCFTYMAWPRTQWLSRNKSSVVAQGLKKESEVEN